LPTGNVANVENSTSRYFRQSSSWITLAKYKLLSLSHNGLVHQAVLGKGILDLTLSGVHLSAPPGGYKFCTYKLSKLSNLKGALSSLRIRHWFK
jgi:hypothetical protein